MNDTVQVEDAKKVATYDLDGNENGFLVELFRKDRYTLSYLTCAKPGAFKGYHLHKVRAARYMCVKGTMKIILYVDGKREEHILSAENLKRLYIPKNIPTGLENIGTEDAWLVNLPDPAYDPDLKDEQIDFTQEELDSGEYLTKI